MMRRLYFFAFFLVLYEFTAYSANDMIMPGMIKVVADFHASMQYVALSLSSYILGNCAFLLPGGYWAERFGKRQVMIFGNLLFLACTVFIIFSQNITQFMVWRFLQGGGLAIISIGYALIHENFNDKDAVKLTALMSNVALLAPLIGPALGSVIVNYLPWQYVFVVSTVLSLITLAGLYAFTPERKEQSEFAGLKQIIQQYRQILKNNKFLLGALCTVFGPIPLLLWISQAPNLILYKLQQTYFNYAIYQFISLSGLVCSSILMQFIAGRFRLYSIIKFGNVSMLLGLIISFIGTKNIYLVSTGLLIYGLGLGFTNGCIIRLIMSIKNFSHTMLASMLGFLQTLLLAVSIIFANLIYEYFNFSMFSFTLSLLIVSVITFILVNVYIRDYRERAWE